MLVFVTGAAGFIGSVTVQELIKHGHQVLGLARSDANAEAITKLGGQVHRGDLEDLESLKSGAKKADGVIHLAFLNDFSDFGRSIRADVAAVEALGEALTGTGKPLVIASVTTVVVKGGLATENTENERGDSVFALRAQSAEALYAISREKQVRGSVVRFPPTVHGKGDQAFVPMLINASRAAGAAAYVGNGENRWPAIHRLDAAVVLRLALEKGKAGATYHAVAEGAVPMKDIVTLIGKRLQVPVESKSLEEMVQKMGLITYVLATDNPTSIEITQKELGWDAKSTTQPGLLEDMEANYFS